MSAPIPSFFKIRCVFIIIAFLLFFLFIGFLKQAFSCAYVPRPYVNSYGTWSFSESCYSNAAQALAACKAAELPKVACSPMTFHTGDWQNASAPNNTPYYITYGNNTNFAIYWVTGSSACDGNGNGTPDACETCPSQTGYKSDILGIITYCGNKVTQCNGTSKTTYEWGFSSDSCTPTPTPPCHVTSDCKKDLNNDGIEDGKEPGAGYNPSNPKADLDGDGIPDSKDCDYDYDSDGLKNCEDPCFNNSNTACTNPCSSVLDGTCADTDGDGIADSQDACPKNADTSCNDPDQADSDGDGVLDGDDPCPHNSSTSCTDPCAGSSDPTCKDTDGDGIADSDDTCPANSDTGCTDPGDDTQTKPYVPKTPDYSHESDLGTRFGDRFRQFITEMKATSIFSIPSQLFGDLPNGGSPSFTINGGETFGEHEVNMDSWAAGLAAIRAVLYIIAGWSAIKIALLGK